MNIGSLGGPIFRPTVKPGGDGGTGPVGPSDPGSSTGNPSAPFDPATVQF